MANTYKIKKGRLYYATDNGRVEEINPQDVQVDGVSYKLHKDLYKELDNKYTSLKDSVETSIFALREFLTHNGIQTPNDTLKALINDLNYLKTIQSGVEYINLHIDSDGYICELEGFSSITNELLNVMELPIDVSKGYYYIEDGVVVKDEQKYEEYWSVV